MADVRQSNHISTYNAHTLPVSDVTPSESDPFLPCVFSADTCMHILYTVNSHIMLYTPATGANYISLFQIHAMILLSPCKFLQI